MNLTTQLPPPPLQGGELKLIDTPSCLKAYPHAVTANEICGRDDDAPLTQPCPGDSGGPLLAQTVDGPVQIGVTSWGAEVKEKACGAGPPAGGLDARVEVLRLPHRNQPGAAALLAWPVRQDAAVWTTAAGSGSRGSSSTST